MPRTEREAPEIGAAAERVLRSLVRRAGEGDTEALEQLQRLGGVVAAMVDQAIVGLHDFGYSYGEVADVMGVSRQAARQRAARGAG